MRFFWKIILLIIPFGGYWLYKKNSSSSGGSGVRSEQRRADEMTPESPPQKDAAEEHDRMDTEEQIIERLMKIEGVTSRVAENLIEKDIQTKEDLTKLSREELMGIKGIGPKRAEKILNVG